MVFRVQPDAPWIDLDYKLLEAYQIMQDEQCPQCGNPIWLCRSDSQNIEWTVRSSVCQATRRIEEANADKRDKKNKPSKEEKADWGVSRYPIPRVPKPRAEEGAVLPTRQDYYESDSR